MTDAFISKTQNLNKRITNSKRYFIPLVAITALCFSTLGQAAILLLEGPISALVDDGDGTGSITVMGVTVDIPSGTPITTPTATLSITAAADNTPLPGRTQGGFIGGTAIIQGAGTFAAGYSADSVFLEPAENILGAAVTSTPGNPLTVGGVSLTATGDPRIPDQPFSNVFGFEVDPLTVPLGSGAVTEGYFSNDGSGVMKYFIIEVEAGTLVNAGITEVSITRAQCREGANPGDPIELRVQGAAHDPDAGSVTISDTNAPAIVFGSEALVADIPPFGIYTFRLRNNLSFSVCPTSVTVDFNGASAVSAVN